MQYFHLIKHYPCTNPRIDAGNRHTKLALKADGFLFDAFFESRIGFCLRFFLRGLVVLTKLTIPNGKISNLCMVVQILATGCCCEATSSIIEILYRNMNI